MDSALNQVLKSNFDAESVVCLTTLLKIIDNLMKQPENPKVRTIRASNPTIQQKIIQKQGLGVLLACGFQLVEGEITLKPSKEENEIIRQARNRIHHVLSQELKVKDLPPIPTFSTTNLASAPPVSFDVYQTQRYDAPSAAVGTNLSAPQGWKSQTEVQLQALQKKQQTLEQKITRTDRHWKAYRATSTTSMPAGPTPLPVDGLTSDSALLAAQIAKQLQERQAADNRGFTTKAMRDLEALKKSKVYSHAHLRIHFADGSVVAGNFGPREKCATIIDALRQDVLVEEVSNIPIELYMTPPKILLDLHKTLQESQLVPAAKIHVKWNQPLPKGSAETGWFLKPSLFQEKLTSEMPRAIAVIDGDTDTHNEEEKGSKSSASATAATKRKMTKAEKEAALLKRMMGQN